MQSALQVNRVVIKSMLVWKKWLVLNVNSHVSQDLIFRKVFHTFMPVSVSSQKPKEQVGNCLCQKFIKFPFYAELFSGLRSFSSIVSTGI